MTKRTIFLLSILCLVSLWTGSVQAVDSSTPVGENATGMVWTPSADVQPDTPDAPNYGQYIVREGDTYWGIAHDAGIDVSTLIEINHLPDTSRLDVGQVLNVPVAQGEAAADVATSSDALSVVVALDNTGSMMGAPFQQQLRAVRQLVTGLGSAPVALVTYSDEAEVALSLTSDRPAFAMSMGLLAAGGDSALYDGALLAISEAARATSDHAVVVLLTDGGETAGLSNAETDEAARIAWANAIPVVGVAIGPDADTDYLTTLAEAAGGKVYTVAAASELADTMTAILADIDGGAYATSAPASIDRAGIPSMESAAAETSRNELAASLLSPTLADSSLAQVFIQALGGGDNAPLLPVPGMNAGSVSGSQTSNPVAIERIPPLLDGLSQLDIVNENDAIDIPVATTILEPETAGAVAEDAAVRPITRIDATTIAESLTSNVAAITIDVAADTDVQAAELALNGYRLQTFQQAPYSYELDTTMLDAGHYNLTFTVANEGGVMSAGTFEFEVAVRDAVPAAIADETTGAVARPVSAGPGMRVLMVDGEPTDLNLTFSTAGGLALVEPEIEALVAPEESLLDILAQPANNLIPPAVREALTTPRPLASALIILTMTLTLLPQGLFTLYWLMYAWNNPKTIEDSQSPREFVAPEISFTALLPARHEEAVIKDTIFAVDRINYPEHLKEVLILCRDDDQGTIAKANEAVAELGKPNIRVVTFSTGPINKPHSLNIGLGEATNDVVAVFDAEDEPHTDIYNVINTVMQRDDADVVQSGVQLMNFKSNWFSALNVLEYFFWFKSGLHCFTRQFQVTPLGGNTVFFKREMLKQIDGWDETCLTEDADVGIRLTLLGANIQIVYDAEHATREETPDTVESFIKQRTRWNQGFYQVFFKGDWAKLPTMKQRITALYILLNSLMQAAILVFLPIGLYIALTQQVAVPIAIISYIPIYLLLLQLLTNLIGIREFAEAYGERLPLGFRLRMIVAYYPYQLLLAVAAGRAIMRQMSQKQTWEKTSHSNLHRQGQVLGRA